MKIHIEDEFRNVTITEEGAVDIHKALDLFCDAMVGLSYHQKTVHDAILAKAEELDHENQTESNCSN